MDGEEGGWRGRSGGRGVDEGGWMVKREGGGGGVDGEEGGWRGRGGWGRGRVEGEGWMVKREGGGGGVEEEEWMGRVERELTAQNKGSPQLAFNKVLLRKEHACICTVCAHEHVNSNRCSCMCLYIDGSLHQRHI